MTELNKERIISICSLALCACTLTSTIVLIDKVNNLNNEMMSTRQNLFVRMDHNSNKINSVGNDVNDLENNIDDLLNKNNSEGNKDELTKDVISPSELAEYLDIPIAKVYGFADKIPHIRIENEYRFNKKAVEEWMITSNFEYDKEVMTPGDLAGYLKININEVYKLINNPDFKIPFSEEGGFYRFKKEEIDEWVKSREN